MMNEIKFGWSSKYAGVIVKQQHKTRTTHLHVQHKQGARDWETRRDKERNIEREWKEKHLSNFDGWLKNCTQMKQFIPFQVLINYIYTNHEISLSLSHNERILQLDEMSTFSA